MNSAETGKRTRERILDAINSYIDLHQYPPTTREICDMVGLKSTCSVNHHVNMMLISGELETDHGFGASRALRVPNRAAKFDALYLAKCQEVNELRAQIDNMTDQRDSIVGAVTINEIREVLEKHKDNIPVVAIAELLAVIEGAEETCEWKQEKILEFTLSDCVTSCGHAEHYSTGIDKYCRHCGKPIKIVEVE